VPVLPFNADGRQVDDGGSCWQHLDKPCQLAQDESASPNCRQLGSHLEWNADQ